MAAKRPIFTENFSVNLSTIQTFLGERGTDSYRRLLDRLYDDIIPILCRFPQAGWSFLAHAVRSTKGKTLAAKLRKRLHPSDDLREFIVDDYLVLYLVRGGRVLVLSIKHHRQLSFDLKRFWIETV